MRLLFLAVLRPHTGNAVTAQRVRDHLEAAGHACVLRDASDFDSQPDVADFIQAVGVEAALALHLYRGGRLLRGHGVPFGIIFGGTDLNEDVNDGEKNQVMGSVLQEARFAVAFTESMKDVARLRFEEILLDAVSKFTEAQGRPEGHTGFSKPHAKGKIYVQSQGIVTAPNAAFDWNTFLRRAEIHQSADEARVFLLVCGLRQVKDPLYLVDAFSAWHQEEPSVYMVIVGPEESAEEADGMENAVIADQLENITVNFHTNSKKTYYQQRYKGMNTMPDPKDRFLPDYSRMRSKIHVQGDEAVDPVFTREVKAGVRRAAGVRLLPEMAQGDLHAALKNCSALVNSSVSEGMSAAVLEAMDLEVPVLARNIPGNAAVVTHEVTGLLFSDPQEFVQLAKRLVSDPALERGIVANGREYVRTYHSWQVERATYQHLVRTLGASED